MTYYDKNDKSFLLEDAITKMKKSLIEDELGKGRVTEITDANLHKSFKNRTILHGSIFDPICTKL